MRTVADGKKPSLAREKLEDVQDFDELEDYFAEKHNATIDPEIKNFKYDGKEIPIDFEGVKEFLMGVEKAFALFPRFAGRINRISVGEVRDKKGEMSAVARFVPSKKNNRKGTRIILSAAHFTSRKLNGTPIIAQIRDDLTNGYSNGKIATKTLEGAGAHEAGHYIQGLLMTKMGFRFFTNETFRVFADEFIKLIHKTSTDPSLYGEKRKRSIGSLTKEISQYATEKPSECIAEAVGDVIENGENAKPFSKVIVKAMKEAAQENDFIDINASFNRQQNSDKITTDKHTWRYKLIISQDFRKDSETPFTQACMGALSPSTVWAWYKADRDRITGTTKNRFPEITNKAERQAALDKVRKPLLDASRKTAEALLEDDNLSEALTGIREDETPESGEEFWEQSFQKQIPDEEIMASTDEWTPERIKEAAKNETLAEALEGKGAIIDDDGNVSFQDEKAKETCIAYLKAIETIDLTLSEEWVDGRPPNRDIRNYVPLKDLNPFQRALYEFAQKLGVTVSFFRGDPNFHGTHLYGISYINVDAKRSASFVFWHEFGHWLKNNQPELYKAIADSIEITQEQIDEKRDTRPDLSDDELRDEIIFDAFRNAAQREGLFKLIGKQDKNLLERFVSWAKAVLDRFTDWFRKPDWGLTTAQAKQMQAAFGKMIRSLTDEHGKKIFRVNNNTHVIEHIDGRALHTWNLDAKAGYSFAGEKAKTAQKKHMKAALTKAIQMEENGASRQEIFDATGWFKGKDGKWRFEIVDDFEKIHLTPLDKRKKATLGEIYHNAALYKAYPPLAKMTVRVYSQADFENDNVKTAMGYYSTARKEIVLNPEYRYDWKEVLVHELQHAVQDIEGFAQGGSGKYAREILVTRGEDISGLSDRDLWFKLGGEQEAEEVRERAEARRKAKIKALSNADRVKAYGKLQKIKSEQSPEIQRLADEYEREIRSKGFTDSARQRKIEKKLPAELREAIVDVHFADVMAKNAVESSGDNVPTIHGEKVLLIYDGKTTSLSFAGANAHTADHDDIRYSGNRNTETPASTKWTDERITEAAKNPQIFNGLTQDGAKLKDGKIVFPNKQARENAIKFLNAVTNPNFKFSIAWHGSPHQFDEFSLDEIGSGEGEQAHGWGLYFTADRKVAEKYRELLTRKSDVVMKVGKRKFVYHGNRWVDEKGNRISFANRQSFDNDALRVLLSETFQILGGESVTKERILRWLQERLRQEQQFFDSSKIRLELAEGRLAYYQKHRNAPKAEYLETFREVRLSKQAVADCESKVSELKDALALAADIEVSHLPPSEGSVLKVEVPDADVMLNEAETLDNQPPKVQTALREIAKERGITLSENMTGEEIYDNIVRTFDYDYASASKLLNKHGVKGIVYDETDPVMDDGHCYVVFDDKAIKILERFPELERRGKLESYLQDDELTTVQKAIQEFCKRMGVPVKFFRSHSDTQGAFQNGEAFINVNSVATPEWVFHHEVGHWLAVNNPQLFNRLVEILDITPEQRDAYRKATKQPDLTDNQVDAEILCDKMGDIAQRLQLFKDVGKADASLVERLVAWFKAALDKFTDFFFKKENGLTRSQRDRLYGTFGKIVRAIVDEKGNRLFRYNNETHAIERADGTPLPQIALTEANAKEGVKYSFAGKKAKTASSSRIAAAELMERRGASKDEIFKATGFVRGRDGLWRFEIEDDLDKIDFNTLVFQNGNGVATLGEIYDNPKLYAAYPDLKSMTVTAFATDGKTVGEYLPVTNSIILNTKHTGKWKTTLVHEIQHAIQEKEGFAKGGSPEQVFDQLIRNKTALEDAISKLPKNSKERKLFESMLESVQQGINDIITGRKTDDDLYWQLGGEQEAREVSDRAERRQISENPAYQGEIERSRKFAEESRRKLNGILANQSARVQSLTSEYWDALEQDEERAAELRKILPKDVRRAADTAFYAEEDANEWNDDGRGTPTIHDKNAIIALDKFGRSASSQTPPSQQQGNAAPKTQTTERNNPYAVDAKDNSTESLTQRIRNWLPAWLGGYGDLNAKGNRRIAQLIKRLIGYKLRFEHLGSNGDAEIDNLNKIIRSRRAYDWVNILPLVGAKLAHKLKLPATPEMANYIANWFLTGAPNDTSAQAKAFQKAARETPAMFELINAIRNEFKDVADASALDLIGREISYGENKKSLIEALPAWWHRFYEEWIDDLDPINRIVDGIKEQYGEDVAAEIEKGTDPYKKGRLYRGMGGLVDGLIIATPKANAETIRTVLRNKSPNLTFANFKPLAVILSSIGKGKKTFEDFNHYCVAKLVKEIHEHNRAHPEKQFPTRFTEEECDKAIEAAEKKYGQKFIAAQKDVVEFSRTILSMLYDAGVLTKEEYEKLLNKWKNYVPLLRIFEEEEDIDYDQLLHERKGSDGTDGSVIHAPILALVANAHVLVKRAERNKVKLSLANLARCGDFDSYVKEVDHKPGEPTRGRIVSFYENGVKKFLDTDPSVVRALNSLEIQSDGSWLMKMISAVTGFMRVNLTARNVDFAGGNFIRDGADAYIHNKHYGWKALPFLGALDAFRLGLPSLIRKDANFYEWLARGGSQSALVSPDIDYTRRSIERIMGKRGIARKAIDSLQLLAEYSEYATRLGGYIRGKKELAKHRPNGKLTDADLNNAAFASREATVDFARAGRSGRKANKGLAFFNAGVQGLDMFARHFAPTLKKLDTEQGREELFGYLFRGVMSSIVLALIQFAVHHDDDWYEKGVADWEKENYWYLAEGLRIPKGFDFSIRFFSTLTDEILRAWVEDEPVKAKRFLDSIKDAAPTLTTTFVTPILEVVLNKKWFTNSYVVPQRLWKKSPERQYDANTSPLGIYFGEKFGTSPKNIDHLIGSYLGYMGTWSAKGFGFGSDELPLVRRFTFTPYKNSAVVSDFYDERNRQWKLHGDFKNTGKAPEGYDKALYSRLNRASKELSKIKDEEEAILWNKKLTSDQRQAKLQKLYKRRVAICEEALGRTQRAR